MISPIVAAVLVVVFIAVLFFYLGYQIGVARDDGEVNDDARH
jgi:uncharacterized membrane protein